MIISMYWTLKKLLLYTPGFTFSSPRGLSHQRKGSQILPPPVWTMKNGPRYDLCHSDEISHVWSAAVRVLLRHSACTSQLICWRQIADCEISPPWRSYELLSFRDSCVLPASSEDVSWVFAGTPKHGLPFSTADNDQCSKAGRDFIAVPFHTLASDAADIYLWKDRPVCPLGSTNS